MLLNMKEILKAANEHNFAVPAFNIGTGQILNGVMDTCEELNAPVILAIHPNELAFQGESFIKMCIDRANKSKLPVCIHLDHSDWDPIVKAIRAGFTSVMIDASSLPFEENVAITKKVCELAHPLGVSVEGELGTIGTTDGDTEGGTDSIIYTNPDDAVRFVEETGCDALAIAIGTAHGFYHGTPVLDKERVSEVKKLVSVPLVLHGASGLSEEDVRECVERGMCKVNFATELRAAYTDACKKLLDEKPETFDPKKLGVVGIEAVKEIVKSRMVMCGCDGKAE